MSNSESWTIGRLLTWTTEYLTEQGCDLARLDAEILLAEARGCQRIELYASFDCIADEKTRTAFRELVRRRAEGTPVAYLTEQREFYSMSFYVTPDVLIPRPETEFVIVGLLDRVKSDPQKTKNLSIADVGTGSGILAICAAKLLPQSNVLAIDISAAALEVAKINANQHEVTERIEFHEGDLFDSIEPQRKFDFILSNPPYITDEEMQSLMPEVKNHEPHLALSAGANGLQVIERLIPQAAHRLHSGGWLLMEISPMIETIVKDLITSSGSFESHPTIKDLAGHGRVICVQRI